ncbi:hypothetical protein KQX54_003453 [Cotesia glomerata]|uniref:Uncharacterized protein n=1 Tax=Cotesia glomerata TaxID=32391 RepID=A0AAV7I4D5_COTGL|nr:hypothetical protein KQX54_003453 [Cotesia glomerata]
MVILWSWQGTALAGYGFRANISISFSYTGCKDHQQKHITYADPRRAITRILYLRPRILAALQSESVVCSGTMTIELRDWFHPSKFQDPKGSKPMRDAVISDSGIVSSVYLSYEKN